MLLPVLGSLKLGFLVKSLRAALAASALPDLSETSKPHLRENMRRLQHCFPDTYPVGYGKCCRDPGSPWYKSFMEPACWDKEFGITFENCCVFEYGPRLRGLPYTGFAEPSALVHFDVPKAGRLRLRSGYDVLQTEEFSTFWPGGWIFGHLMADLHGAVRDAEENGWEEGAGKLRSFLGGDLQILDVSCGLGLSSIAAARAGHNVTATEISWKVLRLVGQNAQRNGVQLRLRRWNLLAELLPPLPKLHGKYHLCLLDLGWLNAKNRAMQLLNGRGISVSLQEEWPSVEAVLRKTLKSLAELSGLVAVCFTPSLGEPNLAMLWCWRELRWNSTPILASCCVPWMLWALSLGLLLESARPR
ncbi:unnamed protein product [Symbiodinium sp. CCMP2456]|nr:unnamed protein product [Symbiodinium sp. CCMP2456]